MGFPFSHLPALNDICSVSNTGPLTQRPKGGGQEVQIAIFFNYVRKNMVICENIGLDNHLDIYMERLEDAREFGRKDIYVFVIQGDE